MDAVAVVRISACFRGKDQGPGKHMREIERLGPCARGTALPSALPCLPEPNDKGCAASEGSLGSPRLSTESVNLTSSGAACLSLLHPFSRSSRMQTRKWPWKSSPEIRPETHQNNAPAR